MKSSKSPSKFKRASVEQMIEMGISFKTGGGDTLLFAKSSAQKTVPSSDLHSSASPVFVSPVSTTPPEYKIPVPVSSPWSVDSITYTPSVKLSLGPRMYSMSDSFGKQHGNQLLDNDQIQKMFTNISSWTSNDLRSMGVLLTAKINSDKAVISLHNASEFGSSEKSRKKSEIGHLTIWRTSQGYGSLCDKKPHIGNGPVHICVYTPVSPEYFRIRRGKFGYVFVHVSDIDTCRDRKINKLKRCIPGKPWVKKFMNAGERAFDTCLKENGKRPDRTERLLDVRGSHSSSVSYAAMSSCNRSGNGTLGDLAALSPRKLDDIPRPVEAVNIELDAGVSKSVTTTATDRANSPKKKKKKKKEKEVEGTLGLFNSIAMAAETERCADGWKEILALFCSFFHLLGKTGQIVIVIFCFALLFSMISLIGFFRELLLALLIVI